MDDDPGPPGSPRFKPLNVVWSGVADTLFVSLYMAGEVRLFDITGRQLGVATVGAGPAQLALTPDGGTLVTANRNDSSASIVDVRTLTERRVAIEGAHPHGVTIEPEGRTAFLTYEGDVKHAGGVVAIDLDSGRVVWQSEAGAYTLGVAYALASRF